MDGLLAGLVIGAPPILNFASPELSAKVVPDVRASLPHNIILSYAILAVAFGQKIHLLGNYRSFCRQRRRWIANNCYPGRCLLGGHWNEEVRHLICDFTFTIMGQISGGSQTACLQTISQRDAKQKYLILVCF